MLPMRANHATLYARNNELNHENLQLASTKPTRSEKFYVVVYRPHNASSKPYP